jgi:hypothetical protein
VLVTRDPYVIGAVYALLCFVGPVWNVAISAYQLAVTPDRIQGRVLGAAGMVSIGAIPLGSLLGGTLLSWLGATATVAVLAVWMVFLAVVASVSRAVRTAPPLSSATTAADEGSTDAAHPEDDALPAQPHAGEELDRPAVPVT